MSSTALASLRALWWSGRALGQARRHLRRHGLRELALPEPPVLPASAERAVRALLRRRNCTCLERALVLQEWRTAHGDPRQIVLGVRNASSAFQAHAWLEGDPDPHAGSFQELARMPARAPIRTGRC